VSDRDAAFLQALETCALPEVEFGHAAHVRAAYLYLRASDFASALPRLQRTIRAYASSLGRPDRYHETITVAYLALIQQHIAERGDGGGWRSFERDNPELFDRDLLLHFYSRSQLESGLARRLFLLPDPHRGDADVNATPSSQAR
jgi:hypothetical protein